MLAVGKKGHNIRQEVRIRIASPPTRSSNGREEISAEFFRLLARLLAAIALATLLISLLLHWRIRQETAELERLTAVNAEVRRDHASLTAKRDELTSKPRVVAAAAVRLGLQLPTKEQEHQLY
ncbi:hypothetical protein [Candidatus Electronema sp. JM]|uniref:hypothetical protein n=1 Tax=Candidatus Electronema sp. JM TaxID=3401571 RepID=UPI003AA84064